MLQRHSALLTPESELRNRIINLQSELQNRDIPLAWISSLTDLYYFTGSIQDGICLVPAQGQSVFFVKKSLERAKAESSLDVRPFPGSKGLFAQAAEMMSGQKEMAMALDVTTASNYLWLQSKMGEPKIHDISTAVRLLKSIKSEWEVAQIQTAANQATRIFSLVGDILFAGMKEIEFSAEVESRLRKMGHGGTVRIRRPGLELAMIYAVSGDAACYPTNFDGPVGGEGPSHAAAAGAGWKEIVGNESLMLDMVTSHNGYHADDARSFFIGDVVPDAAQKAHDFCLEALHHLEGALRPGRTCAEVFREVDDWAKNAGEPEGFCGCGENRVKFFGHGVGLELDEFPIIADRIDLELAKGMIVAVEPKAFLRGIGPVGAENTYLITDEGAKSLCPSPLELIGLSLK